MLLRNLTVGAGEIAQQSRTLALAVLSEERGSGLVSSHTGQHCSLFQGI